MLNIKKIGVFGKRFKFLKNLQKYFVAPVKLKHLKS